MERKQRLTKNQYRNIHMWLAKHYGKATYCSVNKSHVAKRYEWANVSGEYKRDIADYIALCPSCHRKKDFTEETRTKLRQSHIGKICTYNMIPVVQLTSDGYKVAEYSSVKQAAEKTGIGRTAISLAINGRTKICGGYVWQKSVAQDIGIH